MDTGNAGRHNESRMEDVEGRSLGGQIEPLNCQAEAELRTGARCACALVTFCLLMLASVGWLNADMSEQRRVHRERMATTPGSELEAHVWTQVARGGRAFGGSKGLATAHRR